MNIQNSNISIYLIAIISFVAAWYVDSVLPRNFIVAALYTIPVLIVAQKSKPQVVGIFGILSAIVYLTNVLFEGIPFEEWIFNMFGLFIINILAIQLSHNRQDVLQQREKAKEAHHSLQLFLGMVSHDLLQPITAVDAYVQLLEKNIKNKANRKIIDNARTTLHRTQRLITDLRDVASVGSGNFTIQPAITDLVDMIKNIAEQQQTATKTHVIHIKAPKKLRGTWDGDRLTQVFTNLISNAIKYSPQAKNIDITIQKASNEAKVTVTDLGDGISPKQLQSLFHPFSRLQSTHDIPGTGLGLYITKAIIEAHRGHIFVKSTPGKGTSFSVTLPLKNSRKLQLKKR